MRQRIRSHLTYANVMVTMLAFIVLGGMSYAATGGNFVLGKSNSASTPTSLSAPIAGKALQLTNTGAGAGATALGLNVASGHAPFTVNSGTKVANLNADKLDGLDSTAFIRGQGKLAFFDTTVPTDSGSHLLYSRPWFVLSGKCGGLSSDGQATVTNVTNSSMDGYVDNGGGDPLHQVMTPGLTVGFPTHPGGDWLTFSLEYAGRQATAYVFSSAFHNPVLNKDLCQYEGYVVLNGAA